MSNAWVMLIVFAVLAVIVLVAFFSGFQRIEPEPEKFPPRLSEIAPQMFKSIEVAVIPQAVLDDMKAWMATHLDLSPPQADNVCDLIGYHYGDVCTAIDAYGAELRRRAWGVA